MKNIQEIVETLLSPTPCLIYVTGTMYSGKTTLLTNVLTQLQDKLPTDDYITVCDSANTRDTNRDLLPMLSVLPNKAKICFSSSLDFSSFYNKIIIIDEAHLFGVRGQAETLISAIIRAKQNGCKILIAGLLLDCYNNYDIFYVVRNIIALSDRCYILKSRKPCALCGGTENVIYTRNTETLDTTIGDHYENVCLSCRRRKKF